MKFGKMETLGKSSRFTGELLEEHAVALGEMAELAGTLGWGDQARSLEDIVHTVKAIARMIRSGQIEAASVPAFPQRNY
jgi:hypothetical protein